MFCNAKHPWAHFENGTPVRCDDKKGHSGDHLNSFAMRDWPQEIVPEGTVWWSDLLTAHIERGQRGSTVTFLCGHSQANHDGIRFAATRLGADPMFYHQCRRCLKSLAKKAIPPAG